MSLRGKPEKGIINGVAVPMEDYGTISTNSGDDKVNFIREDELMISSDDEGPAPHDNVGKYDPTLDKGSYFRDGKRKIDFVLVYEDKVEKPEKKKTADPADKKRKLSEDERKEIWRQKFLKNLKKAGLDMEEEVVQGEKKMIFYIKLSAPWDVLCVYAEDLSMRAPLQAHPNPSSNWSGKILETLRIPNIMDQEVPNTPLDYYTCTFKRSKLDRFLGNENHDTYFSSTQRSRVVWEILSTSAYGKRKRAEIGIERLLEEGVYEAAFPLHDGPYEKPKHYVSDECLNPRQILQEYWARWGKWYKYQPLDHIRDYFGEKIGIYFAWLGFYTAWLLPSSIVGLLVFMYGLFSMGANTPANELCDPSNDFMMCPRCDEHIGCQYWNLSDVCLYTKIGYLFDHPGTVFYAVFMSFWAVTFLEYWKRKNASLAHHWDCLEFEEEEERPRPQYTVLCPTYEKNPITGIKEPYFPERDRLPRIISGAAAIIIMIVLVLIFIIAVIMYRVLVSIPLFQSKAFRPRAEMIASMTSAVVNLILIMVLSKVYEKLAYKLTQWEMHRTQTEFEDQLTFKVFIFQFVNFYSSIFYIGFFKGRFVGYPGHYNTLFGLRNEECNQAGCLVELAQQLGVIMIGKQVINNAQEILVPKLKAWLHQRKLGSGKNVEKARWEEDYELIENEGLFQEYLEMVLQFGFITIFVAAFPLAPLFALMNNWIEIRLDAQKFVTETRRPVAERAQDIGVWFSILDGLAQLAVISNAFLIAFTSEFLPRLLYKYQYNWDLTGYTNFTLAFSPNGTMRHECRYRDFRDKDGKYTMFFWHLIAIRLAFVIVFEHVVFGICRLIDVLVPDVPEVLELKIKRERYLAKQALADTDAIMVLARRDEEEPEDKNGQDTLQVPQDPV
ncbi:anoctamin-7 isoform X5 [Lingula anatina]|uniref:Anoctamin n=1 Tax=Lingula anatina TaxID=7574 RepID=A0A2R2MPG9_LINAN|nr:anoctamin-7 isoform X5 [Lingula anatina]|eukprot:XP_023932129.1 anoctamin-7 isoform X5 [Lingula anatina]